MFWRPRWVTHSRKFNLQISTTLIKITRKFWKVEEDNSKMKKEAKEYSAIPKIFCVKLSYIEACNRYLFCRLWRESTFSRKFQLWIFTTLNKIYRMLWKMAEIVPKIVLMKDYIRKIHSSPRDCVRTELVINTDLVTLSSKYLCQKFQFSSTYDRFLRIYTYCFEIRQKIALKRSTKETDRI